jgi:hypothetical protein
MYTIMYAARWVVVTNIKLFYFPSTSDFTDNLLEGWMHYNHTSHGLTSLGAKLELMYDLVGAVCPVGRQPKNHGRTDGNRTLWPRNWPWHTAGREEEREDTSKWCVFITCADIVVVLSLSMHVIMVCEWFQIHNDAMVSRWKFLGPEHHNLYVNTCGANTSR